MLLTDYGILVNQHCAHLLLRGCVAGTQELLPRRPDALHRLYQTLHTYPPAIMAAKEKNYIDRFFRYPQLVQNGDGAPTKVARDNDLLVV